MSEPVRITTRVKPVKISQISLCKYLCVVVLDLKKNPSANLVTQQSRQINADKVEP